MSEITCASSLVTRKAPVFKATAVMPDNTFGEISLEDYKGKHVVLFFYPLDFTFVCPSEIIAFDRKLEEFRARDTQVLAVSIDSEYSHFAWKSTPVNKGGIGNVQFPIISDITKKISNDYGVLFNESVALRGLFLIDREGVVRHCTINDLPLGRNVDEALRMVDALQFFEEHGDVCPANWQKGHEGMKPTAEGVAEYLSKN